MWKWLETLLYGTSTQLVAMPPVQEMAEARQLAEARGRTSLIFDSHIMTEAASSKNPQAVSLAWDEGKAYGFNVAPQSWMGMTPRERKETLLSIFLANPWASNCIDTIALYITSGGYTIEPRVENPDEHQRDEIEQFLRRINEDWDFNQYVYDALTDEMIFGECFTEFTMRQGKPYQLFSIDCLTMDTEHDRYGRVARYKQQLTSTSEANYLDPRTIIRWWNPHKRAKVDPFSPLERVQDAILLDKKMTNWMTTFFQRGAKYNYYFKGLGDQDEADRFLTYYRANFTGEKNGQTPPVTWGNAEIAPLGNAGSIDIDFDKGLDRMLTIVLSAFHVPPSIACIAESGNRLTDMSDGQRKILQYIACDPRRHRFFEKFNYRLIHPYFGEDYYVSSRYADFRSEEDLAKVQDMRIRNGSVTINEVRQESGKDAYQKGGDTALFAVSKEVMPVERLDEMAEEQRQTAQVTLDTAKANADLAATKAKQAKEPPAPVPTPLQQPPAQKGKQNDDKQETHTQSHEAHDVPTNTHQHQGNTPLSPTQESIGPDNSRIDRSRNTIESASTGVADQHKAELSSWIADLFQTMKQRASSHAPTSTTAPALYIFSSQEQEQLAQQLAETNQTARRYAYNRDMATAGMAVQEGLIDAFGDLLSWARAQVESIVQTFAEQLQNALSMFSSDDGEIADQVDDWIDRYSDYKAPQIANNTWQTGANEGTRNAIDDMLDALTRVGVDTSGVPDEIDGSQLYVRVVPEESSGDYCKEWAGKSVPIADADQLPYFPAHPSCIHSLEVYVGGEGEDE